MEGEGLRLELTRDLQLRSFRTSAKHCRSRKSSRSVSCSKRAQKTTGTYSLPHLTLPFFILFHTYVQNLT